MLEKWGMIKIFVVADWFHHFDESIREYIKRLPDIEIKYIKPEKTGEAVRIIEKETGRILEILSKQKNYMIYLDIWTKIYSTGALCEHLTKLEDRWEKITFLVGGAYGVDMTKLRPYIQETLSLSPMTFPHGLAFLILLEQIYRVRSIQKWTGYHHG